MSGRGGALDPAVHAWYAQPGPLSTAGRFRAELDKLPEALDALQCQRLGIDFDPLELPASAFWSADRAWRACRRGEAEPERFGILDLRGLWFVGGNVLRDLAAHRRMELQPWDVWGLMRALGTENGAPPATPETLAHVDAIAEAVAAGDAAFDRQRALYEHDDVRVPDVVFDASSGRTVAWREA